MLSTFFAAQAGVWIGGQIHFQLTGQNVQTFRFQHTTAKGRKLDNYPIATKLYPALIFSLIGKPRWLFALLGGVSIGIVMDDRYEEIWLERVIEPMVIDRLLGDQGTQSGEVTIE
jgi:hypothetical protein